MKQKCKKCDWDLSFITEPNFCWVCGFEQSKDPAKEPFCVISIPNAETAAYLQGLLNSGPGAHPKIRQGALWSVFPGGQDALESSSTRGRIKDTKLYNDLRSALEAADIDKDNAPWLTPKAPDKIGCQSIEYQKGVGIVAGGEEVSIKTMELILAKAKGG